MPGQGCANPCCDGCPACVQALAFAETVCYHPFMHGCAQLWPLANILRTEKRLRFRSITMLTGTKLAYFCGQWEGDRPVILVSPAQLFLLRREEGKGRELLLRNIWVRKAAADSLMARAG